MVIRRMYNGIEERIAIICTRWGPSIFVIPVAAKRSAVAVREMNCMEKRYHSMSGTQEEHGYFKDRWFELRE